ncbi:HD domain-containing protein [Streptomyces sp. NPDC090442]|uniref:HD domain-containing protein n=1 Tax=Streptomyces sp. NPDC090442 TaxID=3365962 RepID=UPI0038111EAD
MASSETPSAPEVVCRLLSLAEVEALARRVHAGQTDKAGRPYAEHLAAVAAGVRERGGSEEQVAAAWLHDAVEDDALSEAWLMEAPLSEATKAMVLAVTKRAGEPVEEYTARILATPGALLIKESDLAHNADPVRLAILDAPTQERLIAKYARVRALLGLDSCASHLDHANSQA